MGHWTKEEDKYIVENYLNKDIEEMANVLGRSHSAIIQRATGTLGLKKREFPKNVTIEELIKKYEELQSTNEVGKVFGIHKSRVGYYLKKAGVLNNTIRYTCDYDFFSRDTQESFYWAGFIAADGCVKLHSKKYKQLGIGLAIRDKQHIIKFKSAIQYTGPLYYRSDGTALEIVISSAKIFDDLARFNITPRKSLTYVFPEWLIAHPLVNHFMRGYFDGDGSFYVQLSKKRTVEQLYFALRGTEQCLTTFSTILNKNANVPIKMPRPNSGIHTLEFGGNRRVGLIRDFLYKNSTVETRLDRKYEISHAAKFIDIPEDFKFVSVLATNIETGEQIKFGSIQEAVANGFTRGSISDCCRNIRQWHKGYTWQYDK